MQGIDPAEGQLAFARTRPAARVARFSLGDAMALPFPDNRFDAAVMALVLVFVPDPRKGVDELVRVVAPGGTVATYMWDMLGGGFPLDPILLELREMGIAPPRPPRMEASRMDALREMWTGAGLADIETHEITVRRTYLHFDDLWSSNLKSPTVGPTVAAMAAGDVETLKNRLRARLPADAKGRIPCDARAHAIRGRVDS